MHRMRYPLAKVGLTLTVLLAAAFGRPDGARADLIRPDASQSFPDLSGDIVGTQSYTFDPSTQSGIFQVNNTPTVLAVGPQASSESYVNDLSGGAARSESLQVKLDAQGQMINDPGNSFSVYGTVSVGGKTFSGLLLQGTPTQFGWAAQNQQAPGMSVYDLNVNLTGGLLKQAYGPDAYIRVIAETNSTFNNTFNQSFVGLKAMTNVRSYNAPSPSPIPEPSAFAVLLACGGAGLVYRRRRRVAVADLGGGE